MKEIIHQVTKVSQRAGETFPGISRINRDYCAHCCYTRIDRMLPVCIDYHSLTEHGVLSRSMELRIQDQCCSTSAKEDTGCEREHASGSKLIATDGRGGGKFIFDETLTTQLLR